MVIVFCLQALAPEYAKAAGILAEKGSSIALAKVHQLNSFLISDHHGQIYVLLVGCNRGAKSSGAV